MHAEATVASALSLHEAGLNNCEISRRTGVSRPTIRDWVSGKLPHSFRPESSEGIRGECTRCHGDAHRFEELPPQYVHLRLAPSALRLFQRLHRRDQHLLLGLRLHGLRWTAAFPTRESAAVSIYVSRKADVAKLDQFVGPKR